jgi:hypothetical protein
VQGVEHAAGEAATGLQGGLVVDGADLPGGLPGDEHLEVTRPACEGWDSKTGELNGEQHPPEEQVKTIPPTRSAGPSA